MPIWLTPLIGFVSKRFLHFLVYAVIALLTIGVPYKLFFKPDNKTIVRSGGTLVVNNGDQKEVPLIGCSLWKFKLKAVWQ